MGGPRKSKAPEATTPPEPETSVMPAPAPATEPDGAAADPTPQAGTVETPVPEEAAADPTPPADSMGETSQPADPATVPESDGGDEPDADVLVIVMNIAITGTVDGQEWPPPGGEISLPVAEAERYVRLGYAHLPE